MRLADNLCMHQPSPESVSAAPPQPRLAELPLVTAIACGAALLITVGIAAQSTQPSGAQLAEWGYLPAERIWNGALWALVSSAYVHVALWHLLFNVYWLWRLGGPVERTLGSFNFFAFIIVLALNPWSRPWLEHAAMRLHRDGQYLRANLAYERSLSYGADSAWAFHNLALTYYALGDTLGYQQAVRSLRVLAPGQADSLELRLGSTSSSLPGS